MSKYFSKWYRVVALGSIQVQIKYQYLFSIGYEFCIYHSTGANGWDVTKGTLALFERGPFSLLHHEKRHVWIKLCGNQDGQLRLPANVV